MKKAVFILSLFFFVNPVFAETCQEPTCWSRMSLKHRQKDGVGFHDGYSSIQFFSAARFNSSLLFSDLRAHQFINGKGAGNVGVGYRYGFQEDQVMLGLNGYYDLRQGWNKVFHQVGAGFECLNNYCDLRINGYFPVGSREENLHCFFTELSPNRFLGTRKFHRSLTGVDGELGRNLYCHKKISIYGAGGLYYFAKGNCRTKLGYKGRVKGFLGDHFAIEAILTHDSVFNTKFQGQATLSIPLFAAKKKNESSCTDKYRWNLPTLAQLPERNDMIVFTKGTQRTIANAWMSGSEVLCDSFFSTEPVFEDEIIFKSTGPITTFEEDEIIEKQIEEYIEKSQEEEKEPFVIDDPEELSEEIAPETQSSEETFFLSRFLRYIKSKLMGGTKE